MASLPHEWNQQIPVATLLDRHKGPLSHIPSIWSIRTLYMGPDELSENKIWQ